MKSLKFEAISFIRFDFLIIPMRSSNQSSQQFKNFKRYKITKEMNDSAASDHSKDPLYGKFEKKTKISNEASRIEQSPAAPIVQEAENNSNGNAKSVDEKRELSSQPLLQLVESAEEDPMTHSQSRALISYKIEGNDGVKYVSDLYLQQRIINIRSQTAAKEKSILSEASKESIKPIQQSSESQSEEEEFRRPARYFDEINPQKEDKNAIKCFRCGKRGHIAKNCLQEREKTKCMYCLGNHHHHDCNARACFRCNELGHVAQECRTNAVECHKCKKRGHVQKNCGAVLVMDYTKFGSDKQFRQFYNTEDLRRLRCLNACKVPFGHFNCFEYKDDKQRPYQKEEPKQKKAAREKQRERERERERERQRDRERERERERDRDRERSGHKNNRDWKMNNSRVDPNTIAHQNSKYSGMAYATNQIQSQLPPPQQIPSAIMQPPYMNYGYPPSMPMNSMPPIGQQQPQSSAPAPYFAANPYAGYPPYVAPAQNYPGYSYPNDPYGRSMPQRGPYPDYRSNFDQQNPQKW